MRKFWAFLPLLTGSLRKFWAFFPLLTGSLRRFWAFLPLLTGSLWSAWGLFLGGLSDWAILLALAGVLVLTLWLPGKSAGVLTAGGCCITAAGLLLACCIYTSEGPAKRETLTEVRGIAASVRVSGAKRTNPDYQITLESGIETYWLSGVRWSGTILPLKTGDEVRFLCAEEKGSIYELEINGETLLTYETARARTEKSRSILWIVVLLVLTGLGWNALNEAGRRVRSQRSRRKTR